MSYIFLVSIGSLLLVLAYAAVRAGVKLTGKALIIYLVAVPGLASLLASGLARATPEGSPEHFILFWSIVVLSEDLLRTWFVSKQVKMGFSLLLASLAFSSVATFVEMAIQISDLVVASIYHVFGYTIIDGAEDYNFFFASWMLTLSTIGIYALRPIIHFLLCILLYYAWRGPGWVLYSGVIFLHISLDVVISLVVSRWSWESTNSVLLVTLLFTLILYPATLWIRVVSKGRADGA